MKIIPNTYLLLTFFFLDITFCGLSNPIAVGSANDNAAKGLKATLSRVHRDERSASSTSDATAVVNLAAAVGSNNTNVEHTTAHWLKDAMKNKTAIQNTALPNPRPHLKETDASNSIPPSNSNNKGTFIIKEKGPDPHYVNHTRTSPEYDVEEENHSTINYSGQPKFDEKAVQRTLIVCGGLAAMILVYLALKFVFLKKRKVGKRYGRIDSEMDLLDQMEDDAESEDEDDTLFDLNSTRRSQF